MMSKNDIKVILYKEEYREQFLELQKRLWSPSAWLIEPYLKWKYDQNPSAAEGAIFLAMAGERVVGVRGFTPSSWKTPLPGCDFIPLAGDTVIDPEYEGIGLVQRLTEAAKHYYAERGVALMLNTSASRAVHYISLRSGWKSIGQYKTMARHPVQPHWYHRLHRTSETNPWLWRMLSPRYIKLFAPIDLPQCIERGLIGDKQTLSVVSELDPVSAAALAASQSSPERHAIMRDVAFFTWRFKNPYFRYRFLTCHDRGQLVGYFALRQDRFHLTGNVFIVDWCCSNSLVFHKLLSTMMKFRGNRFEISTMALTPDEESQLIERDFLEVKSAPDEGVKKSMAYQPSLLAMATGVHGDSFDKLIAEGFKIFEFKGIESDSM